MPDPARALSFGQVAAEYDRVRPTYPAPAVRWALGEPTGRLHVLDLGAGTGLLTRVLIGLGHDVVPVEPDRAMRAQLAAATPGVTALAGFAEDIPLPAGSVDAVVAGQAYHWFDPVPALAEIARVLRPGGTFAAMWNERDDETDWVTALTTAAGLRGGSTGPPAHVMDFGPAFGPVQRREFRHVTTHTVDTLVQLVKSRSRYLTAGPQEQVALEAAVRELAATHPDLRGRASFELPYLTAVYRAVRADRGTTVAE